MLTVQPRKSRSAGFRETLPYKSGVFPDASQQLGCSSLPLWGCCRHPCPCVRLCPWFTFCDQGRESKPSHSLSLHPHLSCHCPQGEGASCVWPVASPEPAFPCHHSGPVMSLGHQPRCSHAQKVPSSWQQDPLTLARGSKEKDFLMLSL